MDPSSKKVKKKVVKKVVKKRKESVTSTKTEDEKPQPVEDKISVTENTNSKLDEVAEKENQEPQNNIEAEPQQAANEKVNDSLAPPLKASVIEEPVDVITSEGVEAVARIKMTRGDLLHCVHVTWIKGKWNELTKGDRYDMWMNERTGEHFLKFRNPKESDSGVYRVKAISKSGEEERLFQLKVEPAVVEENKIEIKKGYVPTEKDVEKDVDFRNRLKRVDRSKPEGSEESGKLDVWSLLKNASTREYEVIAFKFGIVDMRGMMRRLSQMSKSSNKKCPSFTKKLPSCLSTNLGEKIVLEVEVANEQMTVKWEKNGQEITPGKQYQIVTKANKRFLIIDQPNKDDNASISCVVGKDITTCEMFVQMPPVTLLQGFEDVQLNCGEIAEFHAEMSDEVARYRILKDGSEIIPNDKFKITKEGPKVTLQISNCQAEDEGFYQFMVNGGTSCGELMVQTELEIVRPFTDLKVNFKDTAEFLCEVSKEDAKGKWLKDGKPLKSGDRIKMIEDGKIRKITVNKVQDSDQGEYSFVADEHPTCSISAALEMTGGHITVEKKKSPPSIYLDHSMKDRAIVVRAGNKLKLDIPISGEPAPVPEWKKGPKVIEEGGSKVRVRCDTASSGKFSRLIVDKTRRSDSGEYILSLRSDEGVESASFLVKIIDIPGVPSVPKISNVTDETCYVQWKESTNDGGCPIKGYMVERKKTKSERWIRLNVEPLPFIEYEARRMIEGTEYQIRIRAVNEVGYSDPSPASIPFTPLAPCSAPTGFRVSLSTDESLELSWLAPLEIGAAGLDGYKLEQQMVGKEESEWTNVLGEEKLLPNKSIKYVAEKLVTGKKYRFRLAAINKAGPSQIAEFGPVVCAAVVEEAKILLPRHLLKPVKVKVGEKLHINVPYQGRPKPQLTWTMEGKELEDHIAIRNSLDSSVLFIRKAERWDSGSYELQLRVGDEKVDAKIEVAVIDIPSKPRQVKLVEVVGNSASLKWEEPTDNGNTDILSYVVEKRDSRSDDWYVVYDKLRHRQCQVSDLVLGNSYYFRVKAFNEVGAGEPNGTKDCANIPKEKTVYKKPEYAPMDFRIKPEFTQLLNNRRIVENYNGTLSCSLKCNPKPKIRWFKNKTEIIDNPKYKMTQAMGIVQLEIRRARAGDAGVYTVIASNEMGDATCSADVTVKEIKTQG